MSVEINATNFPDAQFRSYVSTTFDPNNTGYLSDEIISETTTIEIASGPQHLYQGLTDLTGIEYFVNCEELSLLGLTNSTGRFTITNIDLSALTKLTSLHFEYINLNSSLDITNNTELTSFVLKNSTTTLNTIDISHNVKLRRLYVQGFNTNDAGYPGARIGITSLDVSNLHNLMHLYLFASEVSSLDLSNSPDLVAVSVMDNPNIRRLDISHNPELISCNIACTSIESLDISGCPKLLAQYTSRSPELLSYKGTNYYDYNYPSGGLQINASGVSIVTESTSPGIPIDAEHFPNSVLRTFIGNNYDLNNDGVLSDAEISAVTSIVLNGISDIGIFRSYEGLDVFTEVRTISIENCSGLTAVSCIDFRKLESITIDSCPDLTGIYAVPYRQPLLTTIQVSNCPNLKSFEAYGYDPASPPTVYEDRSRAALSSVVIDTVSRRNIETYATPATSITSMNASGMTAVTRLDLECSLIQSLDLSDCINLDYLRCWNTDLASISFGNIRNLKDVALRNNSLTQLDLPYSPYLEVLYISLNSLAKFDLSNCPLILEDCPNEPGDNGVIFDYRSETPVREWHSANMGQNYIVFDGSTLIYMSKYGIVINTQPESVCVEEGESYSFTFDVTGSNISYIWQKRANKDSPWVNLENNNATYSGVAVAADSDSEFQCTVSNNIGTVISNIVKLTILFPPAFLSFPEDVTITENNIATFSAPATGNDIVYKWQFSNDSGTTWVDIRNSNNNSYDILATLSISGFKYRCVAANSIGEVISDPATLTVTPDTSITPPVITTQPSSVTVAEGSSATFAVEVSGSDISYQWQVFKNNQWTNIQNATSASYVTVGTRSADGNRYRCVISNAAGAVYSNPVTLTVTMGVYVSTPRVLTQPRSVNVELGELVTFWIRADGGDLSYQWQKLNNNTWYDVTGAISPSYSLMARTEVHNTQYRCVISNTAGSAYSNTATLSIRAGHDLSFYGYHSIIISGKNTYGEWEMYPTSRPHVAPPEVKTSYVDLPGADGGLDYTDLLTGEPRYGYRKGSWEFLLIPQDRWAAVYRSLVNFLHGRQHTVILEDDPNYVYTGRLSVNEWQSAAHNSLITIDYILEPFPRNISGQEEDEEENQILSMASTLLNKEKNAGMVIGKLNGAATLIYPDMLFDNGDNIAY